MSKDASSANRAEFYTTGGSGRGGLRRGLKGHNLQWNPFGTAIVKAGGGGAGFRRYRGRRR